MGLVMSPGSVVSQLDEMNQNLNRTSEKAELLLRQIESLKETRNTLQGESYQSIRNYYDNIHIPILHGLIGYAEELIQENYNYKMCIAGNLAGIGYVDEDALKEDLENLRHQMDCVRGIMNQKGYPSSVSGLLDSMEQTERTIVNKLEQIEDFLGASAGMYEGLDTYENCLKSGIECMLTVTLHGNLFSYRVNPLNREQIAELENKWIQKKIKEKELFVHAMSGQFGFDDQTAELLYRLYDRMQQENVENINQKYFAMLASYVYSNSANAGIKNTIWHKIAGTSDEKALNEMLEGYGFTKEEITLLKDNILLNYDKSWLDNEQDADNFYQKNDLSHMSVICATMLNDYGKGWEAAGEFAGGFLMESLIWKQMQDM